jgi:hypothetical protein
MVPTIPRKMHQLRLGIRGLAVRTLRGIPVCSNAERQPVSGSGGGLGLYPAVPRGLAGFSGLVDVDAEVDAAVSGATVAVLPLALDAAGAAGAAVLEGGSGVDMEARVSSSENDGE